MSDEPILYVSHLKKYFEINRGFNKSKDVKAVDDVSFVLMKGETLGIVGETGCGKTTLGRTLLRLTQATDGDVYFGLGKELMNKIIETDQRFHQLTLSCKEDKESAELENLKNQLENFRNEYSITRVKNSKLKKFRKKAQPVFQDPFGSLDPRKLIKDIIGEPMRELTDWPLASIMEKERSLISEIGLNEDHLYRFPHEFSGGQRQRIGILRAISIEPDLLVLDEPTSALDVSVQAQILNLLRDIQERRHISFVFISHHLHVIQMMADKVAVMYLGKIVELADTESLFSSMLHPYTKALFSAIPIPDPTYKKDRIELEGEIPSASDPPTGCYFHTRCPVAMENCGWSPKDMKDSMLELFDPYSNPKASYLPELREIILDQPNMKIKLDFNQQLTDENFDLIKDLIREAAYGKNGAKFGSFQDLSIESSELLIKMRNYDTPELKEVRNGHFVSCLLYDDKSGLNDHEYSKAESAPETAA